MNEQRNMDLDDRPGRASAPAAPKRDTDTAKPAAKAAALPVPVTMGDRGVQIASLDEAMRFCQHVVHSGLAPDGDTPSAVLVKIQAGMELGFSPMRALTAMYVVNKKVAMMGEAALALVRRHGHQYKITVDGVGDDRRAVFAFSRTDDPPGQWTEVSYSVAEAKQAKLWGKTSSSGKPSAWVTSPDDMLVWRAVGRALRRYFGDVTNGLAVYEEARDFVHQGPLPVDAEITNNEPDPVLGQLVLPGTAAEAASAQGEDQHDRPE